MRLDGRLHAELSLTSGIFGTWRLRRPPLEGVACVRSKQKSGDFKKNNSTRNTHNISFYNRYLSNNHF